MSRFRSLFLAGLGIALGTALQAGAAITSPLLTVETATVEAGRTVISGKTAVPGATVSIAGTDFAVKSDIRRTFRFSLAWLPPTCIASLAIGAQTHPAVVANCAPARVGKFGKLGVKNKTPR